MTGLGQSRQVRRPPGLQGGRYGIRLRDVSLVDNMMWGSDSPHSESTFPQSRKILGEILAGVPDDEQAKIAGRQHRPRVQLDVTRNRPCLKRRVGGAGQHRRYHWNGLHLIAAERSSTIRRE